MSGRGANKESSEGKGQKEGVSCPKQLRKESNQKRVVRWVKLSGEFCFSFSAE